MIAGACEVVAPRALSACASTVDGPPPDVQACIAAAGRDCAAARACTYDATHTSLCRFGEAPRCDGEVALTCDGATTTTSQSDCALTGETCVAGPTQAVCALGSCDVAGGARYCAGAIAASCAKPFLLGTDCDAIGADCVATDGGAGCVGRGATCFVDGCAGDGIAVCAGGKAGHRACPAGTRCFPPSGGVTLPLCGIAGECDPSTWFDRCVGGVLSYCHLGRVESVDCVALGFAGCQGSPASGCVVSLVDGGSHMLIEDMALP